VRAVLRRALERLVVDRLLRDIGYFENHAARTRLKLVQDLQRRLRKSYDGSTTYAYEYGTAWATTGTVERA
jgi:hypothetical protein